MIHAYDEYYLDMAQRKLTSLFELAVYQEKMSVDEFTEKFIQSPICSSFEHAVSIYLAGKSANELLGLVLKKQMEQTEYAAFPEYWLGWVLAYTQWYTAKFISEIIKAYPCSKLLLQFFPYHEMDVTKTVELIQQHLPQESTLKRWRKKRDLGQNELSLFSSVPIRSIMAYEQGKLELSKAQGETLYKLAEALGCSIEDLIR